MARNDIDLALRYAIYRTHLLERHCNALVEFLGYQFPEESGHLIELMQDWQREVNDLHDAFLKGDRKRLDTYEQRFTENG